jgi:hypothetical protein
MSPKRRIVRKAAGEYLREAAVLVGVFGPLDALLRVDAPPAFRWWWLAVSGFFSAAFFVGGLYFELKAESEDLR